MFFPIWLTLFSGHRSSRVSSISVVSFLIASLSWISAKQLLKKSLRVLTFFIGGHLISCSNRSGIAVTCPDVDGWLVSTKSYCASKKTSFSCWTSSGAFFCVAGHTYSFPCNVFWYALVIAPPLVTRTRLGCLVLTEIISILDWGLDSYSALGLG